MDQFISIIIPVYNGEKYIKKCLNSLNQQTLPSSQYEVIVVDNGSTDNGVAMTDGYWVEVLEDLKRGSYAARNTGIRKARGSIVAFIDVDCIAAGDWLEQAVKFYNNNAYADIVAGKVEFYSDQPLSVWGYFDKNTFLNQEYAIKTGTAKTANMFVKSSLFEKVGLFDDSLYSGEDVRWTAKALSKGAALNFNQEAVVYHPVRNTFREIGAKCFRVGYGKGQILRKGKAERTDSNLNVNHLRHPFSLLGSASVKNKEKISLLFRANLMAAIFILPILFISGMIKAIFSLDKHMNTRE